EEEISPRRPRAAKARSNSQSKSVFFALLVIVPVVSLGYYFVGQYSAKQSREIKKHLDMASEQLKHDSYASYKLACEAADQVLELEPSSATAHGYLAYAWAIRWGEHGGGDEARKRAEGHLAQAREEADDDEPSSQLIAAEALIKTYAGKGQEALKELDARVKQLEAEGKRSSLLALTLGLIQINAGDLERARESLEKAQALAPDDPRVYSAMGTLFRRLGQDNQAWKNFDFALRYENNHPESLLGKGLLMLEQENAEMYVGAAKLIKRLVEAEPPPSPRQLAMGHLARAFLISRVSNEVGYYKADFQKELLEGTGVPADKKQAQAEIQKAEELGFSLDRTNPELHLIKGRRLFLEGAMDGAIAEIRTAIKTDSSRAQFYVELARALMARKGGEKEAEAALETAVKTMGNSPKLVLMLGQAKQRQGKLDDALKQLQLALGDGKTKAPEARLAMGTIYREKKEYGRAQEQLEKAAQEFLGQNARIAETYTQLARALDEKGDREKANEIYQRALNADANYADAYYFYARHLLQDRKTESKARLTAQEYVKRAPKGEYAQEAARIAE
ncbi:MAG: tetratricopeptide repeat protein, partial [Myxococcaceae bacterium]